MCKRKVYKMVHCIAASLCFSKLKHTALRRRSLYVVMHEEHQRENEREREGNHITHSSRREMMDQSSLSVSIPIVLTIDSVGV